MCFQVYVTSQANQALHIYSGTASVQVESESPFRSRGTLSRHSSGLRGCGKSTVLHCLNRMNDLVRGFRFGGHVRYRGAIFTMLLVIAWPCGDSLRVSAAGSPRSLMAHSRRVKAFVDEFL